MPHENPLEQVVEAAGEVAHAVENGSESDPPPKHNGLRQLIHLITSVTALIAAIGAFVKTCDHSVTKNAYNTLSDSISKIQDEQKKNHDDLVALRGYLDGLARAPVSPSPTPMPMVSTSLLSGSPVDVGPTKKATSGLSMDTTSALVAQSTAKGKGAAPISFSIQAPPVPSVHIQAPATPPPPFAAVEAK